MRIEINAGMNGAASVMSFQSNMNSFIDDVDDVLSAFKTVKNSTNALNGGVGTLSVALDSVCERILDEEKALQHAREVKSSIGDFLELAIQVDKQVARDVNKNREEFFTKYPELRPVPLDNEEKAWYEKAWDWICGAGEKVKEAVDWIADSLCKVRESILDFVEDHWLDIVNWIVTIVVSLGALALIVIAGITSPLLIAVVTAVSAAIIAGTQSITSQIKNTGTVNWGLVVKDAAFAAVIAGASVLGPGWAALIGGGINVVYSIGSQLYENGTIDWGLVAIDGLVGALSGAVAGLISQNLGPALTDKLSNLGAISQLLGSDTGIIRISTYVIMGGISEVASGMTTRGLVDMVDSLLRTGSIDFERAWDAATDPQEIIMDAIIGGASAGTNATDWSRTANSPEELKILREMEMNQEIEIYEVDLDLEDPVSNTSHVPKTTGTFSGEAGNSNFTPNDTKAIAKMKEYGVDNIPYSNYDADFTAVSTHESQWGTVNGKVEIGHMTDQRENGTWEYGRRPNGTSHDPNYDIGNFAQADNEVAKQFASQGVTGKDIERYRKENGLIWHESSDGKTMMLVPEEIHKACPHSGGVSEMKYRMSWGDVTRPD